MMTRKQNDAIIPEIPVTQPIIVNITNGNQSYWLAKKELKLYRKLVDRTPERELKLKHENPFPMFTMTQSKIALTKMYRNSKGMPFIKIENPSFGKMLKLYPS